MSTTIVKKDISFYRGDDISFDVVFRDPNDNNNPLDITGWIVSFTIKKSNSDPDAKAVIQKDNIVMYNALTITHFYISINDDQYLPSNGVI